MKIRPLHDRVVIRRVAQESKTSGGIILSGAESDKFGIVIAVGPGATIDSGEIRPLSVKVGDKILFGIHAGTPVVVEGEEFLILREAEVLGVVEA